MGKKDQDLGPFANPAVRARTEQVAFQVILPQLRAWLPDLAEADARHFAFEAAKEQITTFGPLVLAQNHRQGTLLEVEIVRRRTSLIHISGQDEAPPCVVVAGIAHIANWRGQNPDVVVGAVLAHGLIHNPALRAFLYATGFEIRLRINQAPAAEENLPPS